VVDAVDMLVQPFGVQCPVPPVEYKILQYKVECNLRYNNRPVWQRKRAPKAHEFEGRVGENDDRQVHTDMVEYETQDTSVLISRGVALLLQIKDAHIFFC